MKKHFLSTVLLAAISSMAMAQDITSNLVAHVSFDNGDAAIDAGTATTAGTVTGATSVADRLGNPNSAMSFDGNDYISFGNTSHYQFGYDSFTIACWMKTDATPSGGNGYVIGKRGFTSGNDHVYAITHSYTNGGQVLAYLRDDYSVATSYPTASITPGEWRHVALVVDRIQNYAGLYVNGVPVSGEPLNLAWEEMNATGTFGDLVLGRASNGDQYFKGLIDEAYIFRRALSQADIFALAGPMPVDLTSDLNLYVPFCDGLVQDLSPSNHIFGQGTGTPAADRNGEPSAARTMNTDPLTLPNNLIVDSDFSISVWYYYTGAGQYPRLVDLSKAAGSVSDAIILYPSHLGNSVPFFGMWNSNSQQMIGMQASTVLINEWTHMVVTKVGTTYAMYLNGQPEISTTSPFVPSNVARNISNLGRSSSASNFELFQGLVDEIRVWQRGLTQSEVAALYIETDACAPVAPCDVNIPDVNFKSALVNNTAINTNNDGEIQCSEAAAYTQALNVSGLGISDLTGLEAFTNIFAVNVNYNDFTSIDISANVALTELSCAFLNNSIPTIDLSSNTILAGLDLRSSGINSIDLSVQTNLQNAFLDGNNLTSLDVTNNPQLIELGVNDNDITTIDLSQNLNLQVFYCLNNSIGGNLDLSAHASLYYLIVQNNLLTGLNIANGNNSNFTAFNTISNPFLTCIQVDDAAWSTTNWTNVDNIVSFSENCLTVGVDEAESKAFEMFPNPTTGTLHFSEAIAGQLLDVTGKILIQFPNTRTLDLSSLAEGVYLIRSDNGTVNRIVKN